MICLHNQGKKLERQDKCYLRAGIQEAGCLDSKASPTLTSCVTQSVSLPGLTCMTGITVACHEGALAYKLAYKACTSLLGTWLYYPHVCVCVCVRVFQGGRVFSLLFIYLFIKKNFFLFIGCVGSLLRSGFL